MSRTPFRIIFMGTPDFAVPSLEALIQGPDEIVAVVTQPDRPKGRSSQLVAPPIKTLAEKYALDIHQPTGIKSPKFINTLKSYNPDIIVVADLFVESSFRRFPVMKNGRVIGQISRHDILRALYELA